MDQVETQLTLMDVKKDHLKIILATYKFAKDAKLWWKTVTNRHKVEEMIWDKFKELFYEKYFLISKRWELKDQFLGLIQGNMSVAEYENKFTSLSRFPLEMVRYEVDKTRKFVSGLNGRMRPFIMAQFSKVYSEAVERALMLEVDIKDKNARREQWKQKRGAGHLRKDLLGRGTWVVHLSFRGSSLHNLLLPLLCQLDLIRVDGLTGPYI
ncbi:uncharacterized protein LOC132309949 [Cornus florida]|uniref:uncharacterized protein LOC132309949 n=1 Tax=Cornus florida TaxID=4283 RepID=UPI0028A101FF|nr:uncharacterized protein LOC132309949 [Cornus florida]